MDFDNLFLLWDGVSQVTLLDGFSAKTFATVQFGSFTWKNNQIDFNHYFSRKFVVVVGIISAGPYRHSQSLWSYLGLFKITIGSAIFI